MPAIVAARPGNGLVRAGPQDNVVANTRDLTALAARTPAQRLGDAAEASVAERLVVAGWTVLGRNLRFGRNEVDILAVDAGPPATLVVVEVRWRASRAYGLGEETFDWRKRSHLRAALGRLLEMSVLPDGTALPRLPVRIDLVVVEPGESGGPPRIRHHRGALAS
jgi:putative endonuclease